MLYVVCLVYTGLSSMEIKTEVDRPSNAIIECPHDNNPATGVLRFSGTIFFALISLCSLNSSFLYIMSLVNGDCTVNLSA